MNKPGSQPMAREVLTRELRDRILRGDYAAGELLPPERTLCEETGVSRGSVREAIRQLEAEGLIEVTRGRFGGSRVVQPRRDRLTQLVDLFVRSNGLNLATILDCRSAIEPMMARLAARHRTVEELALLRDLHRQFVEAAEDLPRYRQINYEWHRLIARISGNEPLMAVIEPVLTLALEMTAYEKVTTPENRYRAIAAHAEIMSALADGDEEGAAIAMESHLSAYSRLTRNAEALLDETKRKTN